MIWATLWGTPAARQRRVAVWLLAAFAGLAMLLAGDRLSLYGSSTAAAAAQQARGYRWVGTLGQPRWPAVVVDRDAGDGRVEFVTADGQSHRYEGFGGAMKALHLRAVSGRRQGFTLVFHRPPEAEAGLPAARR